MSSTPPNFASIPADVPLSAAASDPKLWGWMQGDRPSHDRLVSFADANMFTFPRLRWAMSHIRQLVPTTNVSRGAGPVSHLPRGEREDLNYVRFRPIGAGTTMTWAESLEANYTDGILVLHRGKIVYERYFGALEATGAHLAWSVTKSIFGLIAASMVAEGLLDEKATIGRYVPELSTSGFGDATLRQVLDMTTSVVFSEDYNDPDADIWHYNRAGGIRPRPREAAGPTCFYDFLLTLRHDVHAHGVSFAYKTVNTDVLGWALRRVTGLGLADLLSRRVWSQLGAEQDGYMTTDTAGTEFAGGGFNCCLRDLARFGEMVRNDGFWNGRQIVPKAAIAGIRAGADPGKLLGAGYDTLPGASYRNMWLVTHNAHGAFLARGIHGQGLYIDPTAEMVIARYASHHLAGNGGIDPTTLPAYHAMGCHLMRNTDA